MLDCTIFEGPDGAGKSTVIEKLRTDTTRVIHHGPYVGEEDIWLHYAASYVDRSEFDVMVPRLLMTDLFLDRAWQSEKPYSHVYRGGHDRLTTWQRRMLERVALGHGTVTVVCLPPYEHCVTTFTARRAHEWRDAPAMSRRRELQCLADVYAAYALMPADVRYDFTRQSTDWLHQRLLVLHTMRRNPGPGVGAWRPGEVTLMVGQELQVGGVWPFVWPSGCSVWLTNCLEDAGVSEEQLYWVNALVGNGERLDPSFVAALKPRRAVLLGKVADDWWHHVVADSTIPAVTIPHPQWWKRFKAHDPYPLAEALR